MRLNNGRGDIEMKVKFLGKRKRIVHVVRFVKAVSTVVAVLLMIAIAVIASLVAYFWVTGYFKTTSTKISKAIQIENAYYTGQYLGVYVENIGQGKATLIANQCLYVDGALRTSANVNPGKLQETSYMLQESDIALVVDAISLNLGQTIKIKIVTSEGTFVEYSFTINTFQGQNPYSLALFANPPAGGSVAADNNGPYSYGDVVELTANPAAGWSFSGWSGDASGSTNPISIVINGTNTVTATFTQNEYALTLDIVGGGSVSKLPDKATYHSGDSVQLQANAASGWTFSGWSGDLTGTTNPSSVVIDETPEVTATFTQNQYTLTVNMDPLGSGLVSLNNTGPYYYGDVVELTANPTVGWSFSGWSQDLTGSMNPATILIDGGKTVTATFTQNTYTLTISTVGQGSVSLNNTGPYYYGDVVELTANPTVGWSFSGWSQDLTGSMNPATILIDGGKTVTATFTQNTYTLTISTVGQGSVSLNNTGPYYYGDVVELTANPTVGWSFSAWSGDVGGSNNPENILIDGDKSVNAAFSQQTRVIHASAGPHGLISPSGDVTVTYGGDQDFTFTPEAGYSVEDVLVDFVSQGPSDYYNFTNVVAERWISVSFVPSTYTITASYGPGGTIDPSGSVSVGYGNDQAFVITPNVGFHIGNVLVDGGSIGVPSGYTFYSVTADHTIQAFFALDVYTLTVNVNPLGAGIVSLNNTGPYHYGDWVQLTANGNPGWSFSGWSGDASGSAGSTVILMDGDKTVNAAFTQIEYTLTVTTIGNGVGTVTKTPDLATYHYGDSVQLNAAANVGSYFAGWSGDLSGMTSPVNITIDGNKAVNANFTRTQVQVSFVAEPSGRGTTSPTGTQTYDLGQTVSISAIDTNASDSYAFGYWSATGSITFGNSSAASTTAVMNSAGTITAHFRIPTSIKWINTPATLTIGDTETIYGQLVEYGYTGYLNIDNPTAMNGKTISLVYTRPNGTTFTRTDTTGVYILFWNGVFSDSYVPDAVGTWHVYARFDGDGTFNASVSTTGSFTVTQSSTSLTCTVSPTTIQMGSTVTVSGTLTDSSSNGVPSKTVTLTFTRPNSSTILVNVTTSTSGSYTYTFAPDAIGQWSVHSTWAGDANYQPSTSPTQQFTVEPRHVTFVSAGTGSGTTSNPSPAYPSGLAANDLILLQVTVRDTTNTPTTPAGFTLLYGPDSTGTGRQWIYYKFATGTESGTITITISGSNCKIARMYAFRNVALSSFTEGGGFGSGTSRTISAQSVTTTGTGRLTVSFVFVNNDNSVGSFTGEAGGDWTEAVSEFTTSAGSNGCVQLQTATMASAGTISGGSYDMGSGNSDPWGVRAFALIPSP
jgi:FlaG/FlaF family flagellin (archaellin)